TWGEALGSAWAIAMAPFVFAAQTFRRARSGSSRATECLQQNSLQSTQACGHGTAEKAAPAAAAIGPCGRSAGHRAARHIRPPERRLHLATHLHGQIVFIVGDIAPAQASALRDVAFEPDLVGKPERQQALVERARGRNLLAPDAKPAFAVEHLAFLERAFGRRSDVGAEAGRGAGRLLAQ